MNDLNIEVISDLEVELEIDKLADKLRIKKQSYMYDRLCQLANEAKRLGEPKGIYRLSYIEEKGHDYVIAEGVCFRSKLLSANLEQTNRFFAYIATCGTELEEWAQTFTDMIDTYLADAILQEACLKIRDKLFFDMAWRYGIQKASVMCPGALPEWPIKEQTSLFSLFACWEQKIGVQLLDSYLMLPIKSVSGIRYESDADFSNCQLCPRNNCPDRSSAFGRGRQIQEL